MYVNLKSVWIISQINALSRRIRWWSNFTDYFVCREQEVGPKPVPFSLSFNPHVKPYGNSSIIAQSIHSKMCITTDLPTNWLLSVGIICCFLDGHSVAKGFALKFDKDNWKTWFLLFLDIWQTCMFMKRKLGNNFTRFIRTKILTSVSLIDVTKSCFSWCSWIVHTVYSFYRP